MLYYKEMYMHITMGVFEILDNFINIL